MNLDSFQGCFFQDDEEIDALATGLATSILSQARAAGVVRNKVGCFCALTWSHVILTGLFFRGGTRILRRAANPRRFTGRIPGRILIQGPPGLPSGLTLSAAKSDAFPISWFSDLNRALWPLLLCF